MFLVPMADLCAYECQEYDSFTFKTCQYYARLLRSTFACSYYYVQKCQEHIKIIPIRYQKQNRKL